MNKKIFLSYCRKNWSDANIIDSDFANMNISFLRDIRDVNYRDDFRHFMRKHVRESDFVVMLISHEYLRSSFCMFEVCELLTDLRFEERLLPVVLKNAEGIFSAKGREPYIAYWQEQVKEAENTFQKYSTGDFIQERKKAQTILNNLDDFFSFLKNINVLSFHELKKENYWPMLKIAGYQDSVYISQVQKINEIENIEDKEWELDQFLQRHPINLPALYLKIDFCEKRKELVKVKRYLDSVITNYPEEALGYCEMARILFTTDKVEEAKVYLDKALLLDEMSPRIHVFQSLLYMQFLQDTNLDLARKHIERALELTPSEDGYDILYRIAIKQDDYETASISMLRLIDYNPSVKNAYQKLGSLSKLSGNNHDAIKYFKKEIEINPNCYEIYHLLGDCMQSEGRIAEAADYFARYLSHYPDNDEIHFVLGSLYAKNFDNYSLAIFHLNKSSELNPLSKGYYNMGIIYQDYLKDYEKAEIAYRKFLNTNPGDADGNFRLGALLIATNGAPDEIKNLFLQGLESNPENDLAYRALGFLELYKLKNYAAAKTYYEKAVSLIPEDGELYYRLALATFKNGEPQQAETYLRKAEIMNYVTTEVLFMLACLEIDKPTPNKGREYYTKAKNAITTTTDETIVQQIESNAELFLK